MVVSVFQFAPDQYLKPGSVAPSDGVCVFADDALENSSIVFVATEARRFGVFRDRRVRLIVILFFQPEESTPRFAVLPYDLLSGGRTENSFVLAFESASIGVPHVALEAVLIVVKQIGDLRTSRSFAPLSTA